MEKSIHTTSVYCKLCGTRLKKGNIATHMGCLMARYKQMQERK